MTKAHSTIAKPSRLKTHIDAMTEQSINVTPDASNTHLHNGIDTLLPPADLQGAYVNNRPLPTEGITDRKAYIIGSGLGGLSAAFFLIRDGHMPAQNITLLEEGNVEGGALDGAGNAKEVTLFVVVEKWNSPIKIFGMYFQKSLL